MFNFLERFQNRHKNHTKKNLLKKMESNICRSRLSDKQYLQHMIPHHQVAIDISIMLQKKTKSPIMQEILRKLIWTQGMKLE